MASLSARAAGEDGEPRDCGFPTGTLCEGTAVTPPAPPPASAGTFAFPWPRAEFPREFSLGSLRGVRG